MWEDDSSLYFAPYADGSYEFHIVRNIFNYYTTFTCPDTNLSYTMWLDSEQKNFNGPDIYFLNNSSFLISDKLSEEHKEEIKETAKKINEGSFTEVIDDFSDPDTEEIIYYNYSNLLYDYARISLNFDNIENIEPSKYFDYDSFEETENYLSPVELYGGFLFVFKALLSENTYNLQKVNNFLEKLRAYDINFLDSSLDVFGVTSEDIKALCLLNLIYLKKENDIKNYFSTFEPSKDGGVFSRHIAEILNNMGYNAREEVR
ncbi:MAG: hypothetical protein ACQESP_11225 [Candidatus Muiribacteriota bacterium]